MQASLGRVLLSATFFLAPFAASANILCVTENRANLRAGPGTNFKVTWIVGKYMPFKQVGGKGSWLKVQDLDGESHWINSSSVTTRLQCVVVKTKFANLRRAPSSNAAPTEIPTADRYTPFKKVAREGAWLQVEDEYKERYWVSDSNMWWPVKRSSVSF